MRVIPVIDLKDGQVVHARRGQRDTYKPIASPLCAGSDIYRVIDAFLGIYPFETVYIADLNALTGNGGHDGLIAALLSAYPRISFWIDRGYVASMDMQSKPANYWPVLGSESLTEATVPERARFGGRFILSLDFFGDSPRGPLQLFNEPAYWPEHVIVMTLGRVGSAQGPDYRRLESFCRAYPHTGFIAAGGVRDCADLLRLKAMGIKQVLIASALHARKIGAEDIWRLVDHNKSLLCHFDQREKS
jgi:phosphoribosylformimino-5-aminoimidazole carboxamide ribotide isomerase